LIKAKILLTVIYAAIVLMAGVYSFCRPANNWDILPYVGAVYSMESGDTNIVHSKAFETVKNNVDSKTYGLLTTGSAYREAMLSCAKCFYEQFPFYKIKALYLLTAYLIYKLGVNAPASFVLVSCFSYVLINLLCFLWLRIISGKEIIGVFTAIALSIFPFLLNSASEAAPNAFSALIVLAAMYFLVIKKKLYPFCALMLVSIIARPDNIILLFVILAVLYFTKITGDKKAVYIITFISGLVIFKLVDLWAGNYSWKILFEHGFIDRIISPAEHAPVFTPELYFKAFFRWPVLLKLSNFSLQMLIFLLSIYILKDRKLKNNFDLLVLIAMGMGILIHYIVYPVMEDNYFIAQYIVIDLIFIKNVIERLRTPAAAAIN
jgi:hypothetical protein